MSSVCLHYNPTSPPYATGWGKIGGIDQGLWGIDWRKGGMCMLVSLEDLRDKEVISITDGSRYGYVGDVTFDIADGKVQELVVPGRRRFLGLFGPRENLVFPWNQVHRFGQETVLIEGTPKPLTEGEKGRHK